jgi:hypothetical protein
MIFDQINSSRELGNLDSIKPCVHMFIHYAAGNKSDSAITRFVILYPPCVRVGLYGVDDSLYMKPRVIILMGEMPGEL